MFFMYKCATAVDVVLGMNFRCMLYGRRLVVITRLCQPLLLLLKRTAEIVDACRLIRCRLQIAGYNGGKHDVLVVSYVYSELNNKIII